MNQSQHQVTRVKSYGVNNFRALKRMPMLDIKPITLLFGSNGIGKSSFLNSLDLFRSLILPRSGNYDVFRLDENLNLGTYSDIISFNDEQGELIFRFRLHNYRIDQLFPAIEFGRSINFNHELFGNSPDIGLTLVFRKHALRENLMELVSWEISDEANDFYLNFNRTEQGKHNRSIRIGKIDSRGIEISSDEYGPLCELYSLYLEYAADIRSILAPAGSSGDENEVFCFYDDFPAEEKERIINKAKELFQHDEIDKDVIFGEDSRSMVNLSNASDLLGRMIAPYYNYIIFSLRHTFWKMQRLKGVRDEVPRGFIIGDPRNTVIQNDLYHDIISVFEDSDKLEKFNAIIQELGFGEKILLEGSKGMYQAFVRSNNALVNFADMSSGFKQVLPMLLKIVSAPDSVLLMEQPELHLHPKLQVDLIRIIAAAPGCRIIETHSEHMVRKLQLMIARGEIAQDDIAIYFFENDDNGTVVQKLTILENGFFKDPWPNGFFDDGYNLSKELIFAQKS